VVAHDRQAAVAEERRSGTVDERQVAEAPAGDGAVERARGAARRADVEGEVRRREDVGPGGDPAGAENPGEAPALGAAVGRAVPFLLFSWQSLPLPPAVRSQEVRLGC
jgi:hypothetical protein